MALPDPESWIPVDRRPLLDAYAEELLKWNSRVNLVSRTSAENIRTQHIPHCLSIAWRRFPAGSRVIDFGTGGGLPAVPLAIAFPEVQFIAMDGTAKKVAALKSMIRTLGLENIEALQGRAEHWDGSVDYGVSRATAPLFKLWQWSCRVLSTLREGGALPDSDAETVEIDDAAGRPIWKPGLICLKGGDLGKERRKLVKRAHVESWRLPEIVRGATDPEKYILHASAL